jgi:hypothetical protein
MFYINRQFVAGDDPERLAWWNGLWQHSGFRATQRSITAVWGIAYLFRIAAKSWLCCVSVTGAGRDDLVMMAFRAMIVLIAWTRRYMLGFRERRIRELQLSQAG